MINNELKTKLDRNYYFFGFAYKQSNDNNIAIIYKRARVRVVANRVKSRRNCKYHSSDRFSIAFQ